MVQDQQREPCYSGEREKCCLDLHTGHRIGNVEDGQYRYVQDLLKLEATATRLGPTIFRLAWPLH